MGFGFTGGSDISGELIKQLSIVLNHNEAITSKLLQELQILKENYTKLEEVNKSSYLLNEESMKENSGLKLKLAEAVIEIETAGETTKQIQE